MATKPITLVVTFQAKSGKEAELRALLTGLLEPTHKETGCIDYNLHVSADDPGKFLFYENWASKAHLEAHGETPHLKNLIGRVDDLCAGPPQLTFWDKIG